MVGDWISTLIHIALQIVSTVTFILLDRHKRALFNHQGHNNKATWIHNEVSYITVGSHVFLDALLKTRNATAHFFAKALL